MITDSVSGKKDMNNRTRKGNIIRQITEWMVRKISFDSSEDEVVMWYETHRCRSSFLLEQLKANRETRGEQIRVVFASLPQKSWYFVYVLGLYKTLWCTMKNKYFKFCTISSKSEHVTPAKLKNISNHAGEHDCQVVLNDAILHLYAIWTLLKKYCLTLLKRMYDSALS